MPEEAPSQTPKRADLKPTGIFYISLVLGGLFMFGLYDFLVEKEPNKCAMSYMYEMPQYVNLNASHPKYSLFAYGEGVMAEAVHKAQFSGMPVLFIPGNAGSFRQVRSLASIALRKAIEESKYKIHFDYFAVDFVEEYSAIYGGTLKEQAAFVRQSIKDILKLYKGQQSSVVLIGHSVGGLIAKALFLDKTFDASSVNIIVTLATPHSTPVVNADRSLDNFYHELNDFWNENDLKVPLISVGGGVKDNQVRPGLTWSEHATINVQTTSASGIWVSADHRCIVWCKQLTLALNRALFDLIDAKTTRLTEDNEKINQVFQYHLIQRTGGKRFKSNLHPPKQTFDINGEWKDILKRQFTYTTGEAKLSKNTYLMVKTESDDAHHEMLTIDAVNMDNDNWVFACKATKIHNSQVLCESGDNLSDKSTILPSNGKRKAITVNLEELKAQYTHVIVFVAKGQSHTRVSLDVYNKQQRHVTTKLPKWINFWLETRVVKLTAREALFYNVSLLEMDLPWQAYEITATPLECQNKNPNGNKTHFGIMRMTNSWANDDTYSLIGPNATSAVSARITRAKDPSDESEKQSEVHLFLDPDCRYAISIRPSLGQIFGQVVRFYYPMVLPLSISIVLVILAFQLNLLEKEGKIYPCHKILWSQVSPITSVMPARLVASALPVLTYLSISIKDDFTNLASQGIDFGLLPVMMYFTSIGFVLALTLSSFLTVVIFGNVINKFTKRVLNVQGMAQEMIADAAISGISKFPKILSLILLVIATSTCGTVALSLGTLCQFLKLFKVYKSYLEWLVKKSLGMTNKSKSEDDFDKMHFRLALGLLWALTTVLNLPSLLAWSHNISLGIYLPLSPDHSFPVAVMYCLSIMFVWHDDQPNRLKIRYHYVSTACQAGSVFIVAFGLVTLHRINNILCMVILALSVHQGFAPIDKDKKFIGDEEEPNEASSKEKND